MKECSLHGIIGYQPYNSSIDEDLTVSEHLNLFVRLAGVPRAMQAVAVSEIIDACLLKGLENTKTQNMSPGQIKRLTLGMALIGKPKLVVLDNPLLGTDPFSKRKLIKTIQDFTANCSLLLLTEDVEVAQLLGDRIAIMQEGKFMAVGSASEIIESHGQGYSIEILADFDRIYRQTKLAPRLDQALYIREEAEAVQTLKSMQKVLFEQSIPVEFNFSAEFHDQGLLKKLYFDFEQNKPYPLVKF